MSDAPQQVEEKRAEDVNPVELPAAAPVEPAVEGEKKAEDVTALPLPEHILNGDAAAETAVAPATTEAAVEEPKEELKKTAEPVSAGVLGYKAPGLLKQFKFNKRYFWLGEEPVSQQHLTHYLRGTEPRTAQPIAAWSSHTGKGLLYMVKTEAEKSHPHEVLCLADVTDLKKDSPHEFAFKIHGDKHTFKAADDAERDGWYTAIEEAIPVAKESKAEVVKSDKYQETIKHLGAGAAAVGGVAAGSAALKNHESKKEETPAVSEPTSGATEPTEETPATTTSAAEDDAEAKKKENKSRSASRSKRGSIFGALKGKKDDFEAKAAEKKDDKAAKSEEQKEEKVEAKDDSDKHVAEAAAVGGTAVAGTAIAAEESKPTETEDAKVETPKEAPATTKQKRNSIFGSIYQKVRSPTTEKKESDVMPIIPLNDEKPVETSAASTEAPEAFADAPEKPEDVSEPKATEDVAEEAPVAATPVIATEETSKVETPKAEKPETRKKDSFLGGLLNKARAKSPSARKSEDKKEVAPTETSTAVVAKDEPVTAEDSAVVEPQVGEAAAAPEVAPETAAVADEEPVKEEAVVSPRESRRKSYFGSFGQKKTEGESEGEKEKPLGKFTNMFRKPSQLARSATEKSLKKENVATEESAIEETKPEESTTTAAAEESKIEDKPSETTEEREPQSIGDVVPEAVSVGHPQSNPTVSATA